MLLEILQTYPKDFILGTKAVLKPFVKHCVTNPNAESRTFGRKALLIW